MKQVKKNLFGIGLLCLIFGATFMLAQPSSSQTGGIQISEADTARQLNNVGSTSLQGLLNNVTGRIVIRFSNTLRTLPLVDPPAGLDAGLNSVQERSVIRFANSKREILLVPSSPLQTKLDRVVDRIVLRFTNSQRAVTLEFPIGLIPDSEQPIVSDVSDAIVGSSFRVSWVTNELASSKFEYGTQNGSYPNLVGITLIDTRHSVEITGLTPATYYYRITATDRSNNTSVKTGSFVVSQVLPTQIPPTPTPVPGQPTATPEPVSALDKIVYLPLIVR